MGEWINPSVLKTEESQGSVSSNLTASAKFMKKSLIFSDDDFLKLIQIQNISYEEFCDKISVLDIMDRSGSFVVRNTLDDFIHRVSRKDDRKDRLQLYKQNLYKILVTDAKKTLLKWFNNYGKLPEDLSFYFSLPKSDILEDKVFSGRVNSKYGKICKNINFVNFYNTKKLWTTDSEYTFGLLKVMFEDFKIRNSLAGPAFFEHICNYDGDSTKFWYGFMLGANRASIFNPVTYNEILSSVFEGEVLFAPVMGWNAYQLGFYGSNFKKFISTDVISDVVDNGHLLHTEYRKFVETNPIVDSDKEVELYLCPSEKLEERHNFIGRYSNKIDAVFMSPPYFDLEIYPSAEQSLESYPDYKTWLVEYWEQTIILCTKVMKPGAKLGFVISNYVNKDKVKMAISEDMRDVVSKYLSFVDHYRVQWSAIKGKRQAKKTRNGNFEDLWIFKK